MVTRSIAVLLGAGLLASASAALGADAQAPGRAEMSDDGPVLVSTSGQVLYFYGLDDSTPGKSACTAKALNSIPDPSAGFGRYMLPGYQHPRSCVDAWPPYRAEADAQPIGPWGLIDRPDGARQWTYEGRPVYHSARDQTPGDHNGAFTSAFSHRGWRLAAPPSDFPPGMGFTRIGDVLVLTAEGDRPVYTPRNARLQKASLSINSAFKPVAASFITNPTRDWATTQPAPGLRQFTYKGLALFTAPDNLTAEQVMADGEWQMVTYRSLPAPPAAIRTKFTLAGELYTTREGMTLYRFSCVADGVGACDIPGGGAGYWSALCGDAKECSRRWRPYLAQAGDKPRGEWSIVDVPDPIFSDPAGLTYGADLPRVKAWAWRGRPVYTFYQDKEPGDLWGDETRWFALSSFNAIRVPGKTLRDSY